jgi:hypothetical protein
MIWPSKRMKIGASLLMPLLPGVALFEKTAPVKHLDPPAKNFWLETVMACNLKESMQTMTAFGSFKVRRLKRRLKASIPFLYATSNELYNIRYFDAFAAGSVQLKKPSGGPKGLIGPSCHGVESKLKMR